jgi:dTMP kinase
LLSVLRLVDRSAGGRVLVYGSLPPAGRDIDLLVAGRDLDPIVSQLRQEGFIAAGGEWALFAGAGVCKVEFARVDRWRLPPAEEDALFAEAIPFADLTNVAEPSPHHTLLLLATRLSRFDELSEKQRARVRAALQRDPDAWAVARARAADWRAETRLARLESLFRGEAAGPRSRRMHRPYPSRLVSFSGLDGSGKSSQAGYLRDILEQLGFDAFVVWTPAQAISLRRLVLPIRRLLRLGTRSGLPQRESPDYRPTTYPAVVAHVWTFVWVVLTALSLRRALRPHFARGRIIVCDRYALDYAVFLEYRHGEQRSFRVQRWLLRRLSPKPYAAYFLDVAPAVALGRKEDLYALPELTRQAEVYRSRCAEFGARRLDGEQPPDVLSREVATEVWLRLRGRS